jgi:IclR family transcriptional regulator, acetate operon repressor
LLLSHMSLMQRQRLLAHAPLNAYTAKTLTDLAALEQEFKQIKRDGYAVDNEEFLPGLFCLAVLVPAPTGERSNMCVAVQAPIMRISPDKALQWLPALRRAAQAICNIEAQSVPDHQTSLSG